MKMPYACIRDLQPDGYDDEPDPVICRCGHEDYWHEQIGPCLDYEGPCEAAGCICDDFEEGEKDEI